MSSGPKTIAFDAPPASVPAPPAAAPHAVQFAETPPPKPPAPPAARTPTPAVLPERPAPPPTPPKAPSRTPSAAVLPDCVPPPAPQKAAVPPPPPPPPPSVTRAAPSAPRAAFAAGPTPQEAKAIAWAKENFAAIYAADGQHIDTRLQQLLPFALPVVSQWGSSALDRQAKMVEDGSRLVRDLNSLGVLTLTQEILTAQTAPPSAVGLLQRAGGLLQGVLKGGAGNGLVARAAAYRARITGLRAPLLALLDQVEALRTRQREEGNRLPVMLASLSAAAQVAGQTGDAALDAAIDNRRRILQQAITQRQILQDQIAEVRRQIVDQQQRIEQVVTVTLPALEAAAAAAAAR